MCLVGKVIQLWPANVFFIVILRTHSGDGAREVSGIIFVWMKISIEVGMS